MCFSFTFSKQSEMSVINFIGILWEIIKVIWKIRDRPKYKFFADFGGKCNGFRQFISKGCLSLSFIYFACYTCGFYVFALKVTLIYLLNNKYKTGQKVYVCHLFCLRLYDPSRLFHFGPSRSSGSRRRV